MHGGLRYDTSTAVRLPVSFFPRFLLSAFVEDRIMHLPRNTKESTTCAGLENRLAK